MPARFLLPVPPEFNFQSTIHSHGWCMLEPFARSEDPLTLHTRFSAGGEAADVRFRWMETAGAVRVESDRSLNPRERRILLDDARAIFFLDLDLGPFYAMTRREKGFSWIPRRGAGRMMRSPTFFEDAVKMILTTNCSWSLTVAMCRNLVAFCGDGCGLFPTPAQIARRGERFLRERVKLGYRAPYVLELARRTDAGSFDPESFRSTTEETGAVQSRLREIKGIGPYAAENLLKLLGRFDHLGLDSWSRSRYYEMHAGGQKVPDARIDKHYASFGPWKGLAFWLDVTKIFYSKKFPLA